MAAEYRKYLFPHDHPRLADVRGMDPYTYREVSHRAGTFTGDLVAGWRPHYLEPFHGVTDDGTLRPEVHRLDPPCPGEEAPVAAMVAAARELLAVLDEHGRRRVRHPVDAPQWQTWANPEFLQFDTGVRLEFESESVKAKALGLMAASLSPEGYRSARDMMRINGFLGKVVDLPTILHEFGYNIALYGDPHPTDPWGWQLFGHHLALNVLVVGGRMTIGPAFLGAEPNEIDAGEFAGTRSFTPRIDLAHQLMAELTPDQRDASTVYRQMVDPAMPEGRVHPGDERHLAGAFQDNRIIPYEGVRVSELSGPAQDLVFAIVEQFVALLPAGPRAARMREIRSFLDETWFSWIGGHERGDVFYFRIQSPVVITELDHHCGVFLDYSTPKPFHIHTVMRTPHGNDYGRAWALQWNAR